MGSLCTPSGGQSLVSLVFGEVFFAGSASLHDWFLHFLESAFNSIIIGARVSHTKLKWTVSVLEPLVVIIHLEMPSIVRTVSA